MIELLVKTLIPILLLTIVEVGFFFIIAAEDINKGFNFNLNKVINFIFKNEKSKMINPLMLNILEKINERTLKCSEIERKRFNRSLLFNALYLIFAILILILILLNNLKIETGLGKWWIATIIESLILLGMLGYFQWTFLNEIIKNPKFVAFTDSEIKLGIYENVSKLKTPTL